MKIMEIFESILVHYYSIKPTNESNKYLEYLRKKGMKIGNNVFFHPRRVLLDLTRPYLIEIGNNVGIADGSALLTHGYDWLVLKEVYHRSFGSAGSLIIGNNVFIGSNSVILKNVRIGNNVVIGAGSIVTKDIPDNSVYCGNPAKYICSISEYYQKYLDRELSEAGIIIKKIRENLKREPKKDDFIEFFYLFLERDEKKFGNIPVKHQIGNYYKEFMQSKPLFKNFEEFLKYYDNK